MGQAMTTTIAIRCTKEQREALMEFVDGLSTARIERGLPAVDLSTWIRELALKYSGNDRLGMAAQAEAKARAAASIV
jgi:hypothetical protein